MAAREEVERLRQQVEQAKITRARLRERIAQKEQEMDGLLQEAAALGVDDTTKLGEWVEARRQEYHAEKQRIEGLLAEALR
jgi:hypothetical protein